jgi:astacin
VLTLSKSWFGAITFGLSLLAAAQSHGEGQGARLSVPVSVSELRTGFFRGHIVTYRQMGSQKVLEGDILLDHVDDISSMSPMSGRQPYGMGTATSDSLWPQAGGVYTIPYKITAGNTGNIKSAVAQFNAVFKGLLRFVPVSGQHDYVNFDLSFPPGNTCYSYIGDIHAGAQDINGGSDCPISALLHEMGHAVGLYHEQSRFDRDSYIDFFLDNVIDGQESAYAQNTDNAQDVGSYDFASIMHYYAFGFSRNGKATMESKPAGIDFGNGATYSAGDIDTIERLYGAAPKTVTIASLPSGVTVTVDGVATKTPKTFAWAMNSTHTLAVPAGAQTVAGQPYAYGRWSDQTAASHSITVKPGSGAPAMPAGSPALTVYTAAFIHLTKFDPSLSTSGGGTVTGSPAPKSYAGIAGQYYPIRLPVTYTAKPAAGFVFGGWGGQTPNGLNPLPGHSDDFVFAYFVPPSTPRTTIATSPAGVGFLVDNNPAYGPSLFDWDAGSTHLLSTSFPYGSPNTRSVLLSWSDKGAATHSITATSTSRTITASLKLQYKPYLTADPACAASLKYAPASTDGFYDSGKAVQVTGAPAPGWFFAGWTGDLAGSGNPAKVTVTGEKRGTALFNRVAAPLKIASFSPASLPVGASVRTVAVVGTGFTPASEIFVNGGYRMPTYVSATKLTFALTAADLVKPSALDIQVVNVDSSQTCSTYDGRVLFVIGT